MFNDTNTDYDYSTAGFDDFLTRSIDTMMSTNLDASRTGGSSSNSISFDRVQVSGAFGDTVRIGRISINGADGNIVIEDTSNPRIIIGELGDGNQGIIVSEEGYDVTRLVE